MNIAEAERVWGTAYHYWPSDAAFRYFARRPSDGAVYGAALRSPAELVRTTEWADRNGYNSYWQPNPTRKIDGTRCSTADIIEWRWFMVDVDPTSPDARPDKAAAVAAVWVFQHLSSYSGGILDVFSGRGRQLLYPLDSTYQADPMMASRAMAYWLTRMSRELKEAGHDYGCTVDTSCSDLPRAMRLPYTINQKTDMRADVLGSRYPVVNRLLADALINGCPPET